MNIYRVTVLDTDLNETDHIRVLAETLPQAVDLVECKEAGLTFPSGTEVRRDKFSPREIVNIKVEVCRPKMIVPKNLTNTYGDPLWP